MTSILRTSTKVDVLMSWLFGQGVIGSIMASLNSWQLNKAQYGCKPQIAACVWNGISVQLVKKIDLVNGDDNDDV